MNIHTKDSRGSFSRPRMRIDLAPFDGIIGESPLFLEALDRFAELIRRRVPGILVTGESGTGKTLCVRRIHSREAQPKELFFSLQCSAIPVDLLEAEIFGTPSTGGPGSKGRKQGLLDLVGSGMLFLDEVLECPPHIEARLASYVGREPTTRGSRCTIVAATRSFPEEGGKARPLGEFDAILIKNAVELPPLRKRGEDLELLARHFLERWARKRATPVPILERDAVEGLYDHLWPGNVRELRFTLERAIELAPHRRIRREHLRIQTRQNLGLGQSHPPSRDMILIPPEGKSWDRIEEEVVEATLQITGGNRSAAARILGISRPTLGRKIRKYDLKVSSAD